MPTISTQVGLPILTTPQLRGGIVLYEENASSFGEVVVPFFQGTPTLRAFFSPGTADSLEMIHAMVEQNRQRDRERIGALEREVAELREVVGLDRSEPRKLSKAQAKKEIRSYFAQHDGQIVYPSDICEDLNLDYDQVLVAINELEKENKVSKA